VMGCKSRCVWMTSPLRTSQNGVTLPSAWNRNAFCEPIRPLIFIEPLLSHIERPGAQAEWICRHVRREGRGERAPARAFGRRSSEHCVKGGLLRSGSSSRMVLETVSGVPERDGTRWPTWLLDLTPSSSPSFWAVLVDPARP
jgi:hypothetical protein